MDIQDFVILTAKCVWEMIKDPWMIFPLMKSIRIRNKIKNKMKKNMKTMKEFSESLNVTDVEGMTVEKAKENMEFMFNLLEEYRDLGDEFENVPTPLDDIINKYFEDEE